MTTYIIVDYKAKITKDTNATKFSDFAFGSTFLGSRSGMHEISREAINCRPQSQRADEA